MNRTEYIGKLNALYVGEKNCLEELITIYDEQDKEIERLQNIIKEVREYIVKHQCCDGKINVMTLTEYKELLEILDKGSDEISKQ